MAGTETAGYLGSLKVGTAPSPTNSAVDLTDVEIPLAAEMYDTTALGGGGWKTFIAGLRSGTVTVKANWNLGDTTGQLVMQNAFFNATLLYFVASPNGTNTYTFSAYVKDYKVHDPVNNKVEADYTLQITGAVTAV